MEYLLSSQQKCHLSLWFQPLKCEFLGCAGKQQKRCTRNCAISHAKDLRMSQSFTGGWGQVVNSKLTLPGYMPGPANIYLSNTSFPSPCQLPFSPLKCQITNYINILFSLQLMALAILSSYLIFWVSPMYTQLKFVLLFLVNLSQDNLILRSAIRTQKGRGKFLSPQHNNKLLDK